MSDRWCPDAETPVVNRAGAHRAERATSAPMTDRRCAHRRRSAASSTSDTAGTDGAIHRPHLSVAHSCAPRRSRRRPPLRRSHSARSPTPPTLSAAYNRRHCSPIIALRPRELPLTPGTKRQVQTHGRPVIRREIPKECGFSSLSDAISSPPRSQKCVPDLHRLEVVPAGSNQRPSACEAEAKSEPRCLCCSSWTNWTHLGGSEHTLRLAWRIRSDENELVIPPRTSVA
jgi:hypothetical protein